MNYNAIVRRRNLNLTFTPARTPGRWFSNGLPQPPFAPTHVIQMEPFMTMNCILCETTGLTTLKHYKHGRGGNKPCTYDCCERCYMGMENLHRMTNPAPGSKPPPMTTGVWKAMELQSAGTMDAAMVREQEQDWLPDMHYLQDEIRYNQFPNMPRRLTILQLYNSTSHEFKRHMTNYYLEDPANFVANVRNDGFYYTQTQFDTRRATEMAQAMIAARPVEVRQKHESTQLIRAINRANHNLFLHVQQHGLFVNGGLQVQRVNLIYALDQARNDAQTWLVANP